MWLSRRSSPLDAIRTHFGAYYAERVVASALFSPSPTQCTQTSSTIGYHHHATGQQCRTGRDYQFPNSQSPPRWRVYSHHHCILSHTYYLRCTYIVDVDTTVEGLSIQPIGSKILPRGDKTPLCTLLTAQHPSHRLGTTPPPTLPSQTAPTLTTWLRLAKPKPKPKLSEHAGRALRAGGRERITRPQLIFISSLDILYSMSSANYVVHFFMASASKYSSSHRQDAPSARKGVRRVTPTSA